MFGTSRQELALSNQCICQQRGSRCWPMSPWPNFKIPRRTSEARAYRTHVQSNVSLCTRHCREKRILLIVVESQATSISNIRSGAVSMICFRVFFSKWKPLAQITFKCMQKSICQEPLTRVFGVQQFPNNYFWHMPCDIPSMVARCRWTKAHSSSLANHTYINWPFTTIHRWGELGANCPSRTRTPISVTLWSHLWNLRKNPVRDERVRLYDERRWFGKRTCFIMIFGMHPFHVFNTLFYLFWFVSHKFWQISSGMLSCGLQYKLQKLCFSRTRGSSPHGTRRQRRQERWPKKRGTEAFGGISWSCPSY